MTVTGADLESLLAIPMLGEAYRLQSQTLTEFYRLAAEIAGPACPIGPPDARVEGIGRNFFSTLFLAVTRLIVGDSPRMELYAMVNQGMRAWVTACDNLLDREYKEMFPFTFAATGPCVRSVLTLLLADRVVSEFVTDRFGSEMSARVGRVSLAALAASALQECAEEQRPVAILAPDEVLSDIHARKTGQLFEAPLALPIELEDVAADRAAAAARSAVHDFGLGCQILDDAKDMARDVSAGRHNLLVSILHRRRGAGEVDRLRAEPAGDWTAWDRWGEVYSVAWALAEERFAAAFAGFSRIGWDFPPQLRRSVIECVSELLSVPGARPAAEARP